MRWTLLPFLLLPAAAGAQNPNIVLAPEAIEHRLLEMPLEVAQVRSARPGTVTNAQVVLLRYPSDSLMLVKWVRAPDGGSTFNNEPRYEAAAYEVQKLFLDPIDYVVPPSVIRSVPVEWMRPHVPSTQPTFRGTESVVLLLQYWLFQVTPDDFYQPERFQTDTLYARYLGNFNILTHLIQHRDENQGNYLISAYAPEPRVYSVDNGVAFRSDRSERGWAWEDIRLDRLPAATVERLRAITREDLESKLAVLYQFEIRDRELVAVPPGESLDGSRGVRNKDGVVQFGLTRREIDDVWNRLTRLLRRIDEGDIKVFE